MSFEWAHIRYNSRAGRNQDCMHDWLTASGRTPLAQALASDDAAILAAIEASEEAKAWFIFGDEDDDAGADYMDTADKLEALGALRQELAEQETLLA